MDGDCLDNENNTGEDCCESLYTTNNPKATTQEWTAVVKLELQKGGVGPCEQVNLADIWMSTGKKRDRTQRYFLPPEINMNTQEYRKNKVAPVISRACASAGFSVYQGGWEGEKGELKIICMRSRCYTGRPSKAKQMIEAARRGEGGADPMVNPLTQHVYKKPFRKRNRKTNKPLKGETLCPFRIILKFEPTSAGSEEGQGRWYIARFNLTHKGHLQKEDKQPCPTEDLPAPVPAPPPADKNNVNESGNNDMVKMSKVKQMIDKETAAIRTAHEKEIAAIRTAHSREMATVKAEMSVLQQQFQQHHFASINMQRNYMAMLAASSLSMAQMNNASQQRQPQHAPWHNIAGFQGRGEQNAFVAAAPAEDPVRERMNHCRTPKVHAQSDGGKPAAFLKRPRVGADEGHNSRLR